MITSALALTLYGDPILIVRGFYIITWNVVEEVNSRQKRTSLNAAPEG